MTKARTHAKVTKKITENNRGCFGHTKEKNNEYLDKEIVTPYNATINRKPFMD